MEPPNKPQIKTVSFRLELFKRLITSFSVENCLQIHEKKVQYLCNFILEDKRSSHLIKWNSFHISLQKLSPSEFPEK